MYTDYVLEKWSLSKLNPVL